MELTGKIVVVTGGGNGIGEAMVRRFHAEGTRALVVADLDGEAAALVAEAVGGLGVRVDVSRENDIVDLVDRVEREVGPIDLFCSNAGILGPSTLSTPISEWQMRWDVNVMSQVYAARAVVPRMIQRGGGMLLNTASAAGLLNQIGSASYAVTKHASIGFAEWVSLTHAHQGIKVCVLCPQAVQTAMAEGDSVIERSASLDGVLSADEVAASVVEGLREERFLILPHPNVRDYMARKAEDHDRWLRGMNRLQQKLEG